MKISVMRRQRSSWIGYEWYNYAGVRWLNFWVGSPNVHRWWAFSVHFYF